MNKSKVVKSRGMGKKPPRRAGRPFHLRPSAYKSTVRKDDRSANVVKKETQKKSQKSQPLTMAMPMNQGSGPQWANPEPSPTDGGTMQEEEFFAPLCECV